MNNILNLCRICLKTGGKLPLFENSVSEKCNMLTKLTLCLNEKIIDIEGYPRCICKECHDTVETICSFIGRYKKTCNILANRLSVVKDENYFTDYEFPKLEMEIDNIKIEPESENDAVANDSGNQDESLPLLQLKLKSKIKKDNSVKSPKKPKRLTIKAKSTKNDINKIASSILEGDFAWIGDVWCIKSTKSVEFKEKKVKKYKPRRQKELKIMEYKEPLTIQPPPKRLCDVCGVIFKDQDTMNLHKRRDHEGHPMKCPKCPRELVSEYYLKRHLKRRHDTQDKNFTCATCERAFAYRGELTTHIRNVHNKHLKPKKTYTCSICNKSYKCAKSVVVHERSAHTGQRPAVCHICGTSFYHDDYLREHMRLHTGETPFKCPICGRGYAQRCNMKSHLRVHSISELDANTVNKLRPSYLKLLKM